VIGAAVVRSEPGRPSAERQGAVLAMLVELALRKYARDDLTPPADVCHVAPSSLSVRRSRPPGARAYSARWPVTCGRPCCGRPARRASRTRPGAARRWHRG
jgi:hypothetical protein